MKKTIRTTAVILAAVFVAGCVATRKGQADFRDVVLGARARVFPTLVYIRVVREALEGGKNEKKVEIGRAHV